MKGTGEPGVTYDMFAMELPWKLRDENAELGQCKARQHETDVQMQLEKGGEGEDKG